MTQSKHTPGPWKARLITDKETQAQWMAVTEDRKNGHFIANQIGGSILSAGEIEANARLIADAPETAAERDRLKEINAELLAALEAVSKGILPDMDTKDCDYIRNIARAAIAKARGE